MEFRILGPLEVAVGAQPLELGGSRQQVVLATLLLSANTVVTLGRLQEAIYGENLPPTARSQAQISISSLRRLFTAHGHGAAIATRPYGYAIQVGAGQLDAQRFGELVAAAAAARDAGDVERAVAGYRDALRLWRGPALDGLDSEVIRAAAMRLDEQRMAAIEDRLTVELDLGRHHELIGELGQLVEEFPLREGLRGQLMLALYRCDRTADALQVYRRTRRTMIDELGIEPSERLQQLERAILTGDPALDPPARPVRIRAAARPVPRLLPTDIADFTGRAEQLEQIQRRLSDLAGEAIRLPVPVVVIVGQGGVGKTSTAVHASHALAGHFLDGQLFADLHGGAAHPVGPMQVLERFLRALGVPGAQIPEGLDERAEMYRNLVADRRILVVLDDAVDESQVAPLLPGSGTAAVMITSRRQLAGLAGATHIETGVLDAASSLDLLGRIAGADRVHTQSAAAAAVAGHCGHLPLALRIAGARLATRPHWDIQRLADRLADETKRLDELRHGDLGIRVNISLSYDNASAQARRLLRRLALLEIPVFSGWLAAALLNGPVEDAEDVLDDLVATRLIETAGDGSGVHSQYRFHDLIRVFARERLAAEETAAERKAALERALGALLYLAEAARDRHYGGMFDQLHSDAPRWPLPGPLVERLVADPLAWYERERATLVLAVRQAAGAGFTDLCWTLAYRAVALFESRAYNDDWRETHDIALEAARKARHARGQATMLHSLGGLKIAQGQFDPAAQDYATAARLFAEIGDDQGVALVTMQTAIVDRLGGRLDDAMAGYERALALFRRRGDRLGISVALRSVAQVKLELGQHDAAQELLTEALALARAAGSGRIEIQVLQQVGEASLLAGELPRAVEAFELALAKNRDLRDPIGEAYLQRGLGVAKLRLGESGPARTALQRALEYAGITGEPLVEARTLLGLSELALATGDPGQAVIIAQRASAAFRSMGTPLEEARAQTLLARAHGALGDRAAADAASAQAAALGAHLRDGETA